MHVDPWRIIHEWTWSQFWSTLQYLEDKSIEQQRHIRKARVSAGLEKPKLVDVLRDQGIGAIS